MKRNKKFLSALLFSMTVLMASFYSNTNAQQWLGSSTSTGNIYRTGYVGIGVTVPNNYLSVGGNADFGATSYSYAGPAQYGAFTFPRGQFLFSNTNSQNQMYFMSNAYLNASGVFAYRTAAIAAGIGIDNGTINFFTCPSGTVNTNLPMNVRLFIRNDGNIGIGTTNPGSYKLAVEGKIGAREVVVTTAAWADYVFKKDYKLKPLHEVESFINTHGHLPQIPTEKEVKKEGVAVGEMQSKLLAKVEELTLYMIEQNKRIETLESNNKNLVQIIKKYEQTTLNNEN